MYEDQQENLQKLLVIKLSSIEKCEEASTQTKVPKEEMYDSVRQFDLGMIEKRTLEEIQKVIEDGYFSDELQENKNSDESVSIEIEQNKQSEPNIKDRFVSSLKKSFVSASTKNLGTFTEAAQ